MRIAIVRLSATPLVSSDARGVFGGAEVRALTFAKGLADQSAHEVRMVVQAHASDRIAPQGRLVVHPVQAGRASSRTAWAWPLLWQLPLEQTSRLTRSLRRRVTGLPDIWSELCRLPADVYCSFGLHDPTASIVRSAQQIGKPAVVFLTSDDDTQRALDPTAMTDRHRRWHRFAIENADLVVAQTQFQHDRLQDARRSVSLIRNPIDTQLSAGCIKPMSRRRHVLWVGRADTDCKRADLCWHLATQCPNIPFVAVMNPQDPLATQRLFAEAPPNVTVVPRVGWQRSDALYRDALALVNTSDSEGFPNAFLQAAKYGVPVFSRRVNPDQVLTRHGFGFVAHDDLARLATMIRRVHSCPQQFTAVSHAARRYVERYHALDERISQLQAALARFETGAAQRRVA